MNDIGIKYFKVSREDETYKKFQKLNLKQYDIYVNENQIYFVEKNSLGYRFRKFILKLKSEIKTWLSSLRADQMNLLVR